MTKSCTRFNHESSLQELALLTYHPLFETNLSIPSGMVLTHDVNLLLLRHANDLSKPELHFALSKDASHHSLFSSARLGGHRSRLPV
jgi:hypothetical protein